MHTPPSISTHVLDVERGQPARGIRVQLYRGAELLADERTDDDGRVATLAREGLQAGTYRLVFHPASVFFKRLELELEIEDAARHYHVPLLMSSYACATYRGS